MKSLRIGLVDLDTSHPGSFVPIIRSLGHEVVGVCDKGSINPPGYAENFAAEHGIGTVYESLEAMAEQIDLAFIHSCNWDVHVDRARPFIEAGKAVFIDKPLAGNVRDLHQLLDWSKQGEVITGGSALRYAYEVQEWRNKSIPNDQFIYAVAGCANDEFNYGIHAYAMLHGLLGPGIESVRHLGSSGQDQYELRWPDGRRGVVNVGATAKYHPFYATVVTQTEPEFIKVDNSRLYQALLETILPYFSGEAPAPVDFATLIEAELAAVAAKQSKEQGGRTVELRNLSPDDPGYDGAAFARYYQGLKFPSK